MRKLIAILVAGLSLALAGPAITAAPAHAAGITECGNWAQTNGLPGTWHWTYRLVYGYTPVFNLTTRNLPCYLARPFALYVTRVGDYRYHGFRFRVRDFNGEDYDIRAAKGDQVIHWQGGA